MKSPKKILIANRGVIAIRALRAAKELGYQAVVPLFGGATQDEVKDELEAAGLIEDEADRRFDFDSVGLDFPERE